MSQEYEYIFRKIQIPKKYQNKPELSFFSFNVYELLEQCQAKFPEISNYEVNFLINRQPTLACIEHYESSAMIVLHPILNHNSSPMEVLRFIFMHELLHLIIQPREIDGVIKSHPPEFWEAENKYITDRNMSWYWLYYVLGEALQNDHENECTWVKSNWKELMRSDRQSFEDISTDYEDIVRENPAMYITYL